MLRDAGWTEARRTSNGRAQSGRGDVEGGPQGFHIEVKRQERLNLPAALRQAAEDSDGQLIPLVVHRPSRQAWMVTMSFDVLLELLRED